MTEGDAQTPVNRPAPKPTGAKREDPLVGRIFNDRFQVKEMIARGGMGKVYKAIQEPLGRTVALKVLDPTFTGEVENDFHQRFFLEASICARLNHPNTVTIFDYGQTEDNIYYIAMEFLDGRTLHQELKRNPVFPPARALHITAQVCRSVREAHSLSVVHRDLKPANVFLLESPDEADFVKVLDFGLVKNVLEEDTGFTKTGIFMGSPGYMSPEQIRGHALDERSDIYALGAMLFEMLTGRPPFVRESAMDTILAHLNDDIPRFKAINQSMQAPKVLEQVVRKCLAKDRKDRFENMDAFLKALKMVARQTGINLYLTADSSSHNRPWSGGNVPAPKPPPAPPPSVAGPIPKETNPPPALDGQTVALSAEEFDLSGERSDDFIVDSGSITQPTKANRPLFAGIAAAVIFMGALVGYWLTSSGSPSGAAEPAQQTDKTKVATPPGEPKKLESDRDAEVEAPSVTTLNLTLRSRPSGASVALDTTEICEATPCRLVWEGEDAEAGRVVTFRFSLEGYKDRLATRELDGDSLVVNAPMAKIRVPRKIRSKPRPAAPPPAPAPSAESDDEPARKPNMGNYKENPY